MNPKQTIINEKLKNFKNRTNWSNFSLRLLSVNTGIIILMIILLCIGIPISYPYFFVYMPFALLSFWYSFVFAKVYVISLVKKDNFLVVSYSDFFTIKKHTFDLRFTTVIITHSKKTFFKKYELKISDKKKTIIQHQIFDWKIERMNSVIEKFGNVSDQVIAK